MNLREQKAEETRVVKDLEKRIQEYQQNCSEKRKELADEEVKLVSCKQ